MAPSCKLMLPRRLRLLVIDRTASGDGACVGDAGLPGCAQYNEDAHSKELAYDDDDGTLAIALSLGPLGNAGGSSSTRSDLDRSIVHPGRGRSGKSTSREFRLDPGGPAACASSEYGFAEVLGENESHCANSGLWRFVTNEAFADGRSIGKFGTLKKSKESASLNAEKSLRSMPLTSKSKLFKSKAWLSKSKSEESISV